MDEDVKLVTLYGNALNDDTEALSALIAAGHDHTEPGEYHIVNGKVSCFIPMSRVLRASK